MSVDAGDLRENWRILLLVGFLLVSTFALFSPTGSGSDSATNLSYGLDLAGGTRVTAPLVGMTAQDVQVSQDQTREIRQSVAANTSADPSDVNFVFRSQNRADIEVRTGNVSQAAFAAAISAAGPEVTEADVTNDLTRDTYELAQQVLTKKVNQGFASGSVSIVTTPTGERFIQVEVPNQNREQVIRTVRERGKVQTVALYPVQRNNTTEYVRTPLLTQGDFNSISPARQGEGQEPPYVQVTLRDDVAENFTQAMNEYGFAQQGGTECRWETDKEDPGRCLMTVVDGEVVYAAGVSPGLSTEWRDGTFLNNPTFLMQTGNISEARDLRINLVAGALPAPVDIEGEGKTSFLAPSVAQEFKFFSLVTGIIAALAVSGMVYVRYGDRRVAVPMLLTALAEVYILLGFVASVGYAMNLSHIAGFIAVIGTGVDDLVIIADEVLARGEIRTTKVFRSRFRKAFWVIGAAAATTIIAMSPLTVLSLGELSGFAIVTIVGVLIGVLITRPAYGDILRYLMKTDG